MVGQFEKALKQFEDKTNAKLELVLRIVSLKAFTEVVMMSPVDTGRFRGNWQVAVGPQISYLPPDNDVDPSGNATVGIVTEVTQRLKAGETVWLVNNLPYALRLEYGWSEQAPGGMVRLVAQRWKPLVEQIVKELNS
jgi:hypothetical protein